MKQFETRVIICIGYRHNSLHILQLFTKSGESGENIKEEINMKINTIKMICNKNRIISIIITLFTFLTLIFYCSHICEAAGTELVWDESTEAKVTGYYIHCGIEPEIYTNSYQVYGKINTSYLIEKLIEKLTEDLKYTPDRIHIAVTAYTDTGEESTYSNEVIYNNYSLIPQSQLSIVSVASEELVSDDTAAKNAIDGLPDTFWHTEWYQTETTCPHEIVIYLGDLYVVGGFQYLPRQDGGINGTVADYSIYVSEDGILWGEAVATGTFAGNTIEKKITFTGKSGRYVRFVAMSEVNGNPWTSAAEINILGGFLQY